jgi:hypothetical protein
MEKLREVFWLNLTKFKIQIPTSKFQKKSKLQTPRIMRKSGKNCGWSLNFRAFLEFGCWNLNICKPLLLFFLFSTLTSLATSPELRSILPTGAQRGTELEISFNGERLQDAEEIICYEPGIQVFKLISATNKIVKAQCKIAPDCSLGEHHLRLRTATGLSELRTFFIGPYPVIAEIEPNNDLGKAQAIALNTTVQGVITSEDIDCFSIEATRGQRISVEVEGIRLGHSLFDSRFSLLDLHGSILAEVDDTWLGSQDPFVSIIAPSNGTYIVQLRETTYGGNENCQYRLHIGSFPRPTAVYPLGGRAGENLPLTWFSEVTGEFPQPVRLPELPQEKFGAFAEKDGLTAPTPNWLRVSTFTNVLEAPPNQDRQHATMTDMEPPLALNGVISEKGQEDWFSFKAAKDVALEVNVYARRLRSPLDSVIEIVDPQGKSLASNDDATGADSSLKFTPAATTNYWVRIRDTLGKGGHDFTYRIEITPVQPRLTVKIPEVARNDTQSRQSITVPRGNRFATLISAKRADFSSELQFGIENLPRGMSMLVEPMPGNVDAMPLVFEASTNAPIAAKLLDLTATGTNAAGKVVGKFRQEIELVQGPPNNANYYATTVDKLCVAVTKEAPFTVRIVEPQVPMVQAGSMRLQVVAERVPPFDEPITLQMVWNPPGVSSQSEAIIGKGETNVFYQLNAGGGAELRSWKIVMLAHAKVDEGQVYVSSQPAKLEIAAPFLTGKIETLWLNPGATGKLTVNLEPGKPFEGKATIRLAGLPDKVTAPDKEITKEDREVVFDVTVDPKCSLGSHKNLFCAVDVKQDGQVIPHTIAAGGILRIVPKKKEETKVAGKAVE